MITDLNPGKELDVISRNGINLFPIVSHVLLKPNLMISSSFISLSQYWQLYKSYRPNLNWGMKSENDYQRGLECSVASLVQDLEYL